MGACSNLSPVEKCLAIIAHGAHALLDGNLTLAEAAFRLGLAMELGNRRDVFHTFQIRSTDTFSSTIPIDIINNLCHAAFCFTGQLD